MGSEDFKKSYPIVTFFFILSFLIVHSGGVSWEQWWTYEGISGASFWGLINPDWSLCHQGKMQSPVNIDPQRIVYDPYLRDVNINEEKIEGELINTGHGINFKVDQKPMVNISEGPVFYNYPIYSISLHFGNNDESGSEHFLNGRTYVGEIQIHGYNADLYDNYTRASYQSNGLVSLAIFLQIGEVSNPELRKITSNIHKIKYAGQYTGIFNFSLSKLIPDTKTYITYQGSLTQPGCMETVSWILINKPIYITPSQLSSLRKLMQGEVSDPRAPLGGNVRPTQPLNGRLMRTNLNIAQEEEKNCPSVINNVKFKTKSDGKQEPLGGSRREFRD